MSHNPYLIIDQEKITKDQLQNLMRKTPKKYKYEGNDLLVSLEVINKMNLPIKSNREICYLQSQMIQKMFSQQRSNYNEQGLTPEHNSTLTNEELLQAAKIILENINNLNQVPSDWPLGSDTWEDNDDKLKQLINCITLVGMELERIIKK